MHQKNIPLSQIFLSDYNPRFETISINVNGDAFRKHQRNDEKSSMIKILNYESNLLNFLDLIESLSESINENLDKIYVINAQNLNQYIVVEGNRRLLALKLLGGFLILPNINELNFIEDDEMITTEDIDTNIKHHNTKEENYYKIKKIIEKFLITKKNFLRSTNVNFIDSEDKEKEANKIRVVIFTNHVTGRVIGKKNWNRGKTLNQYLNFIEELKNYSYFEKINIIAKLLNRRNDDVKSNVKNAYYIKNLIENAGEDVQIYFQKYAVSALEPQFVKKFINYKNNSRYDQIISFDLEEDKWRIKSLIQEFSIKDIAKSIITCHKNKLLTTREIDTKKDLESFPDFLFLVYGSITPEKIKINKNNLKNVPKRWYISQNFEKNSIKDKIKQLIIRGEDFNKTIKSKFLKSSKWDDDKNLKPFKKALIKLSEQFSVLWGGANIGDIFINGLASTLRAWIEILSYAIMYNYKLWNLFMNDEKSKNCLKYQNNLVCLLKTEVTFEDYKNIMHDAKTRNLNCFYNFIRYNVSNSKPKINNFIQLINESVSSLVNSDRIVFDDWNSIFSHNSYDVTSKFIHSPHLLEIMDDNQSLNQINLITNQLETLKKIFEIIFNYDPVEKLIKI